MESIDTAIDDVLVGSFGYVHYEENCTTGNQQQTITPALWLRTIRIRIPQKPLVERQRGA